MNGSSFVVLAASLFVSGAGTGAAIANMIAARNMRRAMEHLQKHMGERITARVLATLARAFDDPGDMAREEAQERQDREDLARIVADRAQGEEGI